MPSTDTAKRSKNAKTVRNLAKSVSTKVIDELEDQGLPFLDEEEETEEIASTEEVFIQPAAQVIKNGGSPRFKIKKEGQFLTTVNHPYSWEQLQKDFGGGFYAVTCIDEKGRHVKTESQSVAEPPGRNGAGRDSGLGFQGHEQQNESNDFSNQLNSLSMWKTMSADVENKAQQAADRERSASQQMTQLMTTMMTAMMSTSEKSASGTQMMFLEMMKIQQQATKDISESTNRQIQAMNDRFEKLFSKKDDGISMHQLQKDLRDAEDRGYNKAEKIFELIEKKSEEKADLKAELMTAGEGDGSLLSGLTKNILPLLAKGFEAQQAQATLNAEAQARSQEQSQVQARRNAQARIPVEGRQFVPASTNGGQRSVVSDQRKERTAGPVSRPQPSPEQQLKFKEFVLSKVFEPIAEGLGSQKQPEEVAHNCVELLKKHKITAKDVVDNFSSSDIIKIALDLGLPEEVKPWLTEFYASVERMSLSGGARTGFQPSEERGRPASLASEGKNPRVVSPRTSERAARASSPLAPVPGVESPVKVVNSELVVEEKNAPIQTPPRANDAKIANSPGAEVS